MCEITWAATRCHDLLAPQRRPPLGTKRYARHFRSFSSTFTKLFLLILEEELRLRGHHNKEDDLRKFEFMRKRLCKSTNDSECVSFACASERRGYLHFCAQKRAGNLCNLLAISRNPGSVFYRRVLLEEANCLLSIGGGPGLLAVGLAALLLFFDPRIAHGVDITSDGRLASVVAASAVDAAKSRDLEVVCADFEDGWLEELPAVQRALDEAVRLVAPCLNWARLFVKDIPSGCSKEKVLEMFKPFGIKSVTIPPSRKLKEEGGEPTFAFLTLPLEQVEVAKKYWRARGIAVKHARRDIPHARKKFCVDGAATVLEKSAAGARVKVERRNDSGNGAAKSKIAKEAVRNGASASASQDKTSPSVTASDQSSGEAPPFRIRLSFAHCDVRYGIDAPQNAPLLKAISRDRGKRGSTALLFSFVLMENLVALRATKFCFLTGLLEVSGSTGSGGSVGGTRKSSEGCKSVKARPSERMPALVLDSSHRHFPDLAQVFANHSLICDVPLDANGERMPRNKLFATTRAGSQDAKALEALERMQKNNEAQEAWRKKAQGQTEMEKEKNGGSL